MESILFLKLRSLGRFHSVVAVVIMKYMSVFPVSDSLCMCMGGVVGVCVLGIYDLGCIGECINLERLDLSGNNITNLAPLASLRLLLVLNLSANRISNIGK